MPCGRQLHAKVCGSESDTSVILVGTGGYFGTFPLSAISKGGKRVLNFQNCVSIAPSRPVTEILVRRKFWSGDQNSRKIWSARLLFSENVGLHME